MQQVQQLTNENVELRAAIERVKAKGALEEDKENMAIGTGTGLVAAVYFLESKAA